MSGFGVRPADWLLRLLFDGLVPPTSTQSIVDPPEDYAEQRRGAQVDEPLPAADFGRRRATPVIACDPVIL